MQFSTQIPILKNDFVISHSSQIISLGSCFAVNIAEKFDYYQFQNTVNPFGILFHPLAIEKFLSNVVSQEKYSNADLTFNNERWHSLDAHSDLSHSDPEKVLQNLNNAISVSSVNLAKASHIIITYGTSWVYRNNSDNKIVANCHKFPQNQFNKEILSVETIFNSIENTIKLIQSVNPDAKIIFTISPVRHLKDGFSENQWSKSNLISAVQQIVNQKQEIGNPKLHYFPSYEIMMDELRDYRFYAEDMIHPNQTAIDYIWERFSESWISDSATSVMQEIHSVRKGLAHRPFNPESESHAIFNRKISEAISKLQNQFPHIKF